MKTSAAGRAAIEQREGRRLTAYQDSRGIWTIGIGHAATGLPPRPTAGMTITEAECDALLAADLVPVEAVIDTAVKVPLTQNEFDALASLGFNIGTGGLRGSTVVRKLNAGDVAGAADAFMNWGKPAVLTARREAERAQFLTPDADHAGVSATRARALTTKAAAARARARTTATGGAALATVGAVAAVAPAVAHHSHVAWWIGTIVLSGIAIDAVVTVVHRQAAAALSANARAQAAAALPAASQASPPTSPSSIAKS